MRRLLTTGSVSPGHTLTILGDAGTVNNAIVVSGSGSTITVTDHGTAIPGSPFAGVTTAIYVDAGGGDDSVDMTAVTNGLPDTMIGNNGNDTLSGTGSADYLEGDNGADSLLGNSGNDTLSGTNGNDTLSGGNGNDLLSGGDNDDVLNGNNDSDTLDGGLGADDLNGGPDSDVADYSGRISTHPVNVTINGVADDGSSADDLSGTRKDNVGTDVEDIYGTPGDDYLEGSGFANVLVGNAGADTLVGLAGLDFLYQNDFNNNDDNAVDKIYPNDSSQTSDGVVDHVFYRPTTDHDQLFDDIF